MVKVKAQFGKKLEYFLNNQQIRNGPNLHKKPEPMIPIKSVWMAGLLLVSSNKHTLPLPFTV